MEERKTSAPSSKQVAPYCIYDESWFLRWLFVNKKYSQFLLKVLAIFVVTFGLSTLASYLEGNFWPRPDNFLQFLEDYPNFANLLSSILFVILARSFFTKVPLTFLGSDQRLEPGRGLVQAIDLSGGYDAEYLSQSEYYLRYIEGKNRNGRIGQVITYLIMIGFWAVNYLTYIAAPRALWGQDFQLYPLCWTACAFRDFVTFILICAPVGWRIAGAIWMSNRMMNKLTREKRLLLNPISSDKAGGLGSLGNLALAMTYTLAAWLPLVITIGYLLRGDWQVTVALPLYSVALVLVFFLSFGSAHTAMKETKDRELKLVNDLFSDLHAQFVSLASRKDSGQLPERHQLLADIQVLYQMHETASKMPVWPFDFTTMRKFLSVVILPIIFLAFNQITNADSILYHLDYLKTFKTLGLHR